MTATPAVFETHLTAFLANEDSPDIRNPIHSTAGAKTFGFSGAFVGGVTVYGWSVPLIMQALGDGWMSHGWAEINFRRPIYPGQALTMRMEEQQANRFALSIGTGETVQIRGEAGSGDAPWLGDLRHTGRLPLEANTRELVPLTLETAPVGELIGPMAQPLSVEEARDYAREKLATDDPRFAGERPLIHPSWGAGCITRLMYNEFIRKGPSIHVSSRLQYLASAPAGQTCTVQCFLSEVYERKGDHYSVMDGSLFAEDGTEILRLRHTSIFRVAPRS